MTKILDKSANFHSSKKSSPAFEPLVVHIDTELSQITKDRQDSRSQRLLAKYRERFPNVSFECIHLTKIWDAKTLNLAALGAVDESEADPTARLNKFFDSLPSTSSRADILRLLIRHLLLDVALERSYTALLLGHSTTALASLTLSEVANGRGFAVPWQINDGPFTVSMCGDHKDVSDEKEISKAQMPVYYPLREVFKNEINTYVGLVPSLVGLVPNDDTQVASKVVSHKELSISEVMERYFESVEGPYSGIVANVVRTTGKLDRLSSGRFCTMCGMTSDEQGDSRWAGELGEDVNESQTELESLCYGCRRSLKG